MLKERVDCVYDFIRQYLSNYSFAPSIREIAEGCYISSSYVLRCLDVLEAQERLTREPGKARSIRLRETNGRE
jgi:SOS-response transcriptional repressor LexA